MLTETQKAFFSGHLWKTTMHLNMDKQGVLVQTCEALGISKKVVTPKTKGRWGYGTATYFIDGDEREFATLEELAKAKGIE